MYGNRNSNERMTLSREPALSAMIDANMACRCEAISPICSAACYRLVMDIIENMRAASMSASRRAFSEAASSFGLWHFRRRRRQRSLTRPDGRVMIIERGEWRHLYYSRQCILTRTGRGMSPIEAKFLLAHLGGSMHHSRFQFELLKLCSTPLLGARFRPYPRFHADRRGITSRRRLMPCNRHA